MPYNCTATELIEKDKDDTTYSFDIPSSFNDTLGAGYGFSGGSHCKLEHRLCTGGRFSTGLCLAAASFKPVRYILGKL